VKQPSLLVISALLLFILLGASVLGVAAQDTQPIVHAVLFYSPSCPHCQYVINEVLPPLTHKYGGQLQIIGFDVTQPQGAAMFYAALDRFGIQQESVPLLVIDNITLAGSDEIPDKFPALIESYLKLGGVAWPDIPGMREMLVAAAQTATAEAAGASPARPVGATPAPGAGSAQSQRPGWQQRLGADVTANSIAVALLIVMLGAVVWALMRMRRASGPWINDKSLTWLIPALCLLGLMVAGYLAYIEATDTRAVCGPIGDCNTVQQSPYSHLFGVISIGAFGLIGYSVIIIAWAWARLGTSRAAAWAAIALFVLALLGTLFSIYFTFLEQFVIGATCAWCITSAALMTALMLLTAGPAGKALVPALSAAARVARKPRTSPRGR
jgi:uncharacterized membrane protein